MSTLHIGLLCVLFFAVLFAARISLSATRTKGKTSSAEKKINALLKKMTLEEKLGQLHQRLFDEVKWNDPDQRDAYVEELAKDARAGRIGSIVYLRGAEARNRLQKAAVEESRLGIPLILGHDVNHGYRTVFPIPLGEAASWDAALAEKAASIAAREARAAGIDWTFAPMVDIARDPRWGRIAEGAGEDPYLGSVMAAARVRGFQGEDPASSDRIVACLKHYVGYGAAEGGRDYNTCEISERTLREIYLPPFKAGVEAGAGTVMSAFNEIGGVPTSASRFTLTDVLRGEWRFDGFVVSDWNAVGELVNHGIAADSAEAGKLGLWAGVDLEMVSECFFELADLIRQGEFPEEVVDEAARRILRMKFRAGLFDEPYVDASQAEQVILHADHLEVARDSARKSLVLVKNEENILPLKRDVNSIALIGPLADNQQELLGAWAMDGQAKDVVPIRKGIEEKISPDTRLHYAPGCEIDGESTDGFEAALEAVRKSDVAIVAVGEAARMSGEAASRSSLDLPGIQTELVRAIHGLGKPVVAIVLAGRPLSITWVCENVPAVLIAWHPGVQGGRAIADVLFGDYNPSGKLPVTFPRNVGQVPIYYNHKNTGRPPRKEDPLTSKYIDIHWSPLLPFGHGLSYTTFKYDNLRLSQPKTKAGQSVTIEADVTNTGEVTGEEVVQLYVRDLVGSVTRPVKELKGFEKIELQPGETRTVSFTLTAYQLKFYNLDMEFVLEPGEFKVWVGPSSVEGLEGLFEIIG